jgi:hypothetical protein
MLGALVLAGCSAEVGPSSPSTPPAGDPDQPPKPAPVADYSGVYAVTSNLDFTQNGVLPGLLGPALAGLSELHDHPGDALLTILEAANIPYVSAILKKLPSALESVVASYLDDLIIHDVYQGVPVVDQIASLIMGLTEISRSFDVHDTVTVHAPMGHAANLEQQLSGVDFKLLGKTTTVAFPTAETVKTIGTITPHGNAPVADADLTVGAATFQLPIGDLLLKAAGPLVFSQFGATDLSGALKNLVDCGAFGQSLSNGLGGILSANEGTQLCAAALGLVADLVTQKIEAITFHGVRVDRASGRLYDVSAQKPTEDYQSDRVADGAWTWTFTVAGTGIDVPALFSGDRIGDAQ